MRILILGGTRFVGRAIVDHAVSQGHSVTVLTRGSTTLPEVENLVADRNDGLTELGGREWDATVDVCAYRPGQVRTAAQALGERAGVYTLISTVSVYSDAIPVNANESAPLVDTAAVVDDPDRVEMSAQTYGPLKVLCEQLAHESFAHPLIIRPTYVIGPRDYTARFPAWVQRIAENLTVDCPGPADAAMQYVDARDQAAFVVGLLERGVRGTFHCAAPPTTFAEMLTGIAQALEVSPEMNWLDAASCQGRESEFPLWASGESTPMLHLDPTAALEAGLCIRPFADTVRDTRHWQLLQGATSEAR